MYIRRKFCTYSAIDSIVSQRVGQTSYKPRFHCTQLFIGILVFTNLHHFVLEVGYVHYRRWHIMASMHIDKWHFRRFSRVNVIERQRDAGERGNRSSAK